MNLTITKKRTTLALAALTTIGSLGLGATAIPAADAASIYGPDTCISGYVWRDGRVGDHVCVTPATRTATAADNAAAASRVQPGGGAYGPDTCKQGSVWRPAWTGDHVCVTPATRTQAAADNAAAASRRDPNWNTWYIDANSFRAANIQEDGIFSNGDEFYVATIAFRTTPGRAGSTSAWFVGGLSEVDTDQGETHSIPNAMGRAAFPSVTQRSLADVIAGRNPELIGTISVVFESDATPFSSISSKMRSMASTARTEIAKVVEPLTLADLTTGNALASRLATASKNIKDKATPNVLEGLGLWLSSFGDPDDLIGFKVSVFAAVDASLAATVDSQIGTAIPAGVGFGGALRDRTYSQRFSGDGATYDVNFYVD